MSLRMLIRLGALALGLILFSPLLWQTAGPWPLFLGLGLFISRGIIRDHGGHITVDSAPGPGTPFAAWLPE